MIENSAEWDELVMDMAPYDIYHTYSYHLLSANSDEKSILVRFEDGKNVVALPLIIRSIEGTRYKDATSAYGYVGPVAQISLQGFNHAKFKRELQEFLVKEDIVSVFSRLNPFIPQQELLSEGLGDILNLGKVVYLDLQQGRDEHRKVYHKRLKTYLNKLGKMYTVRMGESDGDIDKFMILYHENMRRVHATDNYFFPSEYFYNLLKNKEIRADLLLAEEKAGDQIVAGAIFFKNQYIAQYHLSGVMESHLKLNPVKLLIDQAAKNYQSQGIPLLNLGGGVGNKEDSLFQFKAGFSDRTADFKLWKYIVNRPVYDKLVELKFSGEKDNVSVKSDFFPLYRYKDKKA